MGSGTGIGDLVVSLEVQNEQFLAALNVSGASLDEFAGHTGRGSQALGELGERGEEAGGHAAGSARAFGFLGRQIKEMGEGLEGTNAGLGETVSGLGSTVSGLGEAVHGYHALHTAIEVASGAQMFLNSISPLGWTVIATGAIAAAYAYMTYSESSKAAAEEEKRREEEKKAATQETESAIKSLQREVDKLDKTPLQQFQESLEKSGKSAQVAAEELRKFQALSARKEGLEEQKKYESDRGHAIDELAKKQRDLDQSGMTEGQKFGANFAAEHPGQTQERKDQATALGERMDQMALEKKTAAERDAQAKHLDSLVSSLTEGPMDKFIAQARELKAGMASGQIGSGQGQLAMDALQKRAAAEAKPDKEEAPKALEFGTAAAFEEIYKQQHPDADHAQRTAENTAKMAELLAVIADNSHNTVSLPR